MYYNDKPIEQFDEDVLGRAAFAKNLATALTNLKGETYTIGLYGKWGSGKTSIINMMLKELESQGTNKNDDEKFIIVKFEPWNFSDNEQLINQFFIRLASEFRSKEDEKRDQIGDALINYSYALELSKLIPFAGNVIASILTGVAKDVGENLKNNIDEKDIIKQKQYVIDRLKESGKNILIIIDDIDRLSSEQIRHVFQLVAYVANFPNTIYLLSFEKDVVVKSLEKVQEGNGEEYLEKVIQMPIQVPKMRENVVIDILIAKISKIIDINNVDEKEYKYFIETLNYISPFISGIRDVNRIYNTFYFKYKGIESEINFTDMLCLTFLEIRFNKIYEWIKNNKHILTGKNDYTNFMNQKSANDFYNEYFSHLQTLLSDTYTYDIKEKTEILIEFIAYIFPYFGGKINKSYIPFNSKELLKENKVGSSKKFDRYFSLDIDSNDVKHEDIFKILDDLEFNSLKKMLIDYDNKNLSYEFLEEIEARKNEIYKDKIRIILEVLFSLSFELKDKDKNYFSPSSASKAYVMILDLMALIPKEERLVLFKEMIEKSDSLTIYISEEVIKRIEWGYGRQTENGVKRNYKKVVTIEELDELERVWGRKVKKLLEVFGIFSFVNWVSVLDFMEKIDKEYTEIYILEDIKDEKNILKYLRYFINIEIHRTFKTFKKYNVTNKYEKYLKKDKIINVINKYRVSGELFDLEKYVQGCCASFVLDDKGKVDEFGLIDEIDVENLLKQWKKEYEENNELISE